MNSGRHECALHARRLPAALLALAAFALAPPSAHAKLSTPSTLSTSSTPSTERSGSTTFQPFNLSTFQPLAYAYDHRGRIVRKDIKHRGTETQRVEYTWDNWNIIRETHVSRLASRVTHNVWGLDLDGTLQGTGGVGGLLAVVRDDGVFLPAYDANGNITEYVSTNGEVVAHYDYSPFGEQLISSGPLAASFTHRFSTKPWCSDTGLVEYQLRKYRPDIGRWMSRDPIEELAGLNLMEFVSNQPQSRQDKFGLKIDIWDSDTKEMSFAKQVVSGFQEIIGDCVQLAQLYFVKTKSVPVSKGKTISVYLIKYKEESSECICDVCWQVLQRVLNDKSRSVSISYSENHGNACTDGPDVLINPNLEVYVPELDESGVESEQMMPFPVVLWHEAIGHGVTGWAHDDPVQEPRNTRTGNDRSYVDQVIEVENLARECLRKRGEKFNGRTLGNRVPFYYDKD